MPVEFAFTGTLRCERGRTAGTGIFVVDPSELCRRVRSDPAVFDDVGMRAGRVCTQIYGGPQRARVMGTIDAGPLDVAVSRADGCGIEDWRRLEWLLGPPERSG